MALGDQTKMATSASTATRSSETAVAVDAANDRVVQE